MGTQGEEKGIGTGSFNIQVNELIHNDKMGSYGNKSNLMQHMEEKSHDHEHHEGMKLSLIHISEPTRLRRISYAVFCLKKKKKQNKKKQEHRQLKKKKKKKTKQQKRN